MRAYELMVIVDGTADDAGVDAAVKRIGEQVQAKSGEIKTTERWGRRRFAYEIDHKTDGVYHLLQFDAPPDALDEVSRVLKITDGVVRHGAYRRVQGSTHQKAPAQAPAPAPASAAAGSADDSDEAAE